MPEHHPYLASPNGFESLDGISIEYPYSRLGEAGDQWSKGTAWEHLLANPPVAFVQGRYYTPYFKPITTHGGQKVNRNPYRKAHHEGAWAWTVRDWRSTTLEKPVKSRWERLLGDGTDILLKEGSFVDEPKRTSTMKTKISAEFEGTVGEFNEWIRSTFVEAESLVFRVTFGGEKVLDADTQHVVDGWKRLAQTYHRPLSELPMETLPTLIDHVKNGRKIEAIKQVRNISSLGLKEAKDFVEIVMWDRFFVTNPFTF